MLKCHSVLRARRCLDKWGCSARFTWPFEASSCASLALWISVSNGVSPKSACCCAYRRVCAVTFQFSWMISSSSLSYPLAKNYIAFQWLANHIVCRQCFASEQLECVRSSLLQASAWKGRASAPQCVRLSFSPATVCRNLW